MTRVLVLGAVAALATAVHVQTRPGEPRTVREPAPRGDSTPAERGRVVYDAFGCAMCHGADGAGGFRNPNAETDGKVPGVQYVAEGFTAGELRQKLLNGTPVVGRADPKGPRPPFRMPGWAGRMSDEEVDALVAYLVSLYPKSAGESWR